MMEISNSLVGVLIVAAIAISAAGTLTTIDVLNEFLYPMGEQITGRAAGISGTVNVTVNSSLTISWVKQQVNFLLNPIDSGLTPYFDNTTDGSPTPLAIRNDGSVTVNVSICATRLFNTSAAVGASDTNYTFKCGDNTSSCDTTGGDNVSIQNFNPMNITSSTTTCGGDFSPTTMVIWNMSFYEGSDVLEIELNVTAPSGEASGYKKSTLILEASQACADVICNA
jgi:hypothetical protein